MDWFIKLAGDIVRSTKTMKTLNEGPSSTSFHS